MSEISEPHVSSLTYRLVTSDFFEFQDPPDLVFDAQDFKGRVSAGVLTLEPKLHFATEEEAKAIADPLVRAWEIQAALRQGRPAFRFEFRGSMIIERSSGRGSSLSNINLTGSELTNLQFKILDNRYPDPPTGFTVTPEVEVLYKRLCRYWANQEPLPSMAYSCLTFLERVGGRASAAKHYDISLEVLRKLGELTFNRGDETTTRKFTARTTPLSHEEQTWIQATIKAIVRHLATRRPGIILKMVDIPPLP